MKNRNKNKIILVILPMLILGGFFVGENAKALEITSEVIWTKSQSPIIVNENILIRFGGKLIIKPGVVVKFYPDRYLGVAGIFNANGTEDEPIVFTSIKDDEYGGDSNNDGNNTQPQPLDWAYLYFGTGSESIFNNVIVQYGGGFMGYYVGVIQNRRGKLTITNSKILNNAGGIDNSEGDTTISNSSIYNNLVPFIGGIFVDAPINNNSREDIIVNVINNWWGTIEGPCPWKDLIPPDVPVWNVDIVELCGDKPLVDLGVVYDPWLTSEPTQEPPEPEEQNPVIIVPGIMGSWYKHGEWVIDPVLHTYDNLIEAMVQSGYEIDNDLFLFPYNWRNDNVLTAGLLKNKIDEVKAQTESEKVDIVAHSMGGLISRFYVQGSEYEDDVDQLIFLNTPHQGSPESYLVYEGAYFTGSGLMSLFKKATFQLEAIEQGYLSLVKYIREQVVSTEQLLPVYDYLQVEVNNDWQYKMYPVQYPRNNFLENLNIAPAVEILKKRVDVTNIISSSGATSTLTTIRVIPDPNIYDNKWMDGYLNSVITGNGDGTVPYSSLDFLEGVQIIEMADAEHREIVTKAQQDVIEILNGTRPEDYYKGSWSAIKRVLFVRVYSPVDFVVYAPDGRAVGKNFVFNTEINQIEGSFYSGFDTETEFVTIINPQDGDYRVELQGTDNGTYELGIDILEDNNLEEPEENLISGIISVGNIEIFNFNYEESNETPKIEIQKEIDFDSLIKDLEELHDNNEIHKKSVYKSLHKKFRHLSKIYDKIEEEKHKKKYKLRKKFIKLALDITDKKLKFYLKKNWITETAYNVLNNDINNLINNLN